jgi:ABC-type uncharacterized transport system substrate-binding protein
MLLPANWARAGEVVIVLSADAAAYHQAESGYRGNSTDPNRPIRTVLLKDVTDKGVEATIGKNADALLAIGTPAATYLHGHLGLPTPLVYCMVAMPTTAGLTEGRACFGVTTRIPVQAQFELIAQALPKARVLGMLYRSNTPDGQQFLEMVRQTIPKDWQLQAVAVDKFESVAAAIDELANRHPDVVWTTVETGLYDTATIRSLLLSELRTNAPVFGFSPAFVRAGALVGVGVDPAAQGQQAAALMARILANPTDKSIPQVQAPESFQIAVNLIVADQMGIHLPTDLIRRATYAFKGNN